MHLITDLGLISCPINTGKTKKEGSIKDWPLVTSPQYNKKNTNVLRDTEGIAAIVIRVWVILFKA